MARVAGRSERAPRFDVPESWPDWVLAFGRGWHEDTAAQARIRAEWVEWRRRRDVWAEGVPGFSASAALEERRRRAGLG